MQMRIPNSHSLVQKELSWLIRKELLWLVGEEGDGDRAVQLQLDEEKCQSYWLK